MYGTLIADLSNRFATAAASMLTTYEPPVNLQHTRAATTTTSAATTTTIPPTRIANPGGSEAGAVVLTYAERCALSVAGSDGVLLPGVTCFTCRGYGHRSRECPTVDTSTDGGLTLVQHGFVLAQPGHGGIDPRWILLDSQSTISVFNNPTILTNIRKSTRTL